MRRELRRAYYEYALAHPGLLTAAQVQALKEWSNMAGYKRIGAMLGISRDSARGRVDRARELIDRDVLQNEAA